MIDVSPDLSLFLLPQEPPHARAALGRAIIETIAKRAVSLVIMVIFTVWKSSGSATLFRMEEIVFRMKTATASATIIPHLNLCIALNEAPGQNGFLP
jgi:hypothetical protein